MEDARAVGNAGPQADITAAGTRHLRGTAILISLGSVCIIFQASWELGGLCINDQMQIIPSGHRLLSPNFTALLTRTN